MARDRRVLGVGQTELRERGARAAERACVGLDQREKALEQDALEIFARELGVEGPADQLGAATRDGDGRAREVEVAEQLFLGNARGLREGGGLHRVERAAVFLQLRAQPVREREIHVVAAEQDVLTDCDALEGQLAVLLAHGDQREVAGAAADVDDQDGVVHADLPAPVALRAGHPAVQGGLWLLEQHGVPETCGARGFGGELARSGIERGRHRDGDQLLAERRVDVRGIPGGAQVLEIAHAGLERRDLGDVGRSTRGQDGGAAIDGGVAEPALGAGDQPRRALEAECARDLTHREAGRVVWPGQRERARGQLLFVRQVQKRRQQLALFDLAGCDQLGDTER